MEELLSEMKMENKYNLTVKKESMDLGNANEIETIKCLRTKHGSKLDITINFKGETVDLYAPLWFDSAEADFENKFKNLLRETKMENNYNQTVKKKNLI